MASMVPLTEVMIADGARGGMVVIYDEHDPDYEQVLYFASWKASTIGPMGLFYTEVYESVEKFEKALARQEMKERQSTLQFDPDPFEGEGKKKEKPIYLPTRRLKEQDS